MKRILGLVLIFVMFFTLFSSNVLSTTVKAENTQTVWFGNYFQTKVTNQDCITIIAKANFTNGTTNIAGINIARKNYNYYYSTPIEWIILEDNGDTYTLISKKILSKKVFDSKLRRRGWHDSEIRTWCNETFFNYAFSQSEQDNIIKTTVNNICLSDDPMYSYGNISTTDYVWLLSEDDVNNNIFSSENDIIAYTTEFSGDNSKEYADTWYLRGNPYWFYYNEFVGKYISSSGTIHKQGGVFDGTAGGVIAHGVRPVIKVKKSAVSITKPEKEYDFSLLDYDNVTSLEETEQKTNDTTPQNKTVSSVQTEKTVGATYVDGAFTKKKIKWNVNYSDKYFDEKASSLKKATQGKLALLSMAAASTVYDRNNTNSIKKIMEQSLWILWDLKKFDMLPINRLQLIVIIQII